MRVITWNLNSKNKNEVWRLLLDLDPNIALLQEVVSIPEEVKRLYSIKFEKAINKDGSQKRSGTAVLAKKGEISDFKLSSELPWVNKELEFFAGNLISCVVKISGYSSFNVISVYSPAWSLYDAWKINGARPTEDEISQIKLKQNTKLWVTEILWSALKNTMKNTNLVDAPWIVGGDFNSSESFDPEYRQLHNITTGLETGGNKEIRERMYGLGFKECLLEHNGMLVPTFRGPRTVVLRHQIDHLFVTKDLLLQKCDVGDNFNIFENKLSDHLPIIAEFANT